MEKVIYGYIRVSTKEQNEARQVLAIQEYGIDERNRVMEKQSGKNIARPLYRRLVKK